MRILILNYEFPPLGGGAAPVTHELAKEYVKHGHVVDVVTMYFKGLKKFEVIEGVNIYRIECLRDRKEMSFPHELLSFVIYAKKFLRKRLKKIKYDINHTHFILPTGLISLWLKKHYKIPYIITAHGSDIPGYNPDRFKFLHMFTKPLLKKIIKNAKKIITPSNYLQYLIKKNIGFCKNIKTIPNGIDSQKFKTQKKKKMIVSSGRLLPRKGFQYLIKAVKDLDIGYELHILGDGPYRKELQKLSIGSKTKIIFHGWISNESDKYKNILEQSKIYCLASLKENASIALLEAMSASCAVITTNISGCPETVGDAGFLVDPKNSEQIKDYIVSLTSDSKLMKKYQKLSRHRLVILFTWDKISEKYLGELK